MARVGVGTVVWISVSLECVEAFPPGAQTPVSAMERAALSAPRAPTPAGWMSVLLSTPKQ